MQQQQHRDDRGNSTINPNAGIGMTEATRRSTRNATAAALALSASEEGTQGGSVAHSQHDPLQSPQSQQDKAHTHCPAASASTSSGDTAKKQIHGLLNLELCAGSAEYSAKLIKHGPMLAIKPGAAHVATGRQAHLLLGRNSPLRDSDQGKG
jgi:hypothetical protein